jgi:spore protease
MLENSHGIVQNVRGKYFNITEVLIQDELCGKRIGKKIGRYITLESKDICKPTDNFENLARELSEELKRFIPDGSVLISGLGNHDVTPDSLGVTTARSILATRHFREEIPEDELLSNLREVSVITAGVLAQTGIESSEIIKALVDKVSPKCVIVIDAFACSNVSRLGTTIQISDSGIHPGSGVNNSRKEISKEVLGIPVIAIGVPTVVDMHTIAENLTGNAPSKEIPNLMVTPRNVDSMVEYSSKLLSEGISMALHPNFK